MAGRRPEPKGVLAAAQPILAGVVAAAVAFVAVRVLLVPQASLQRVTTAPQSAGRASPGSVSAAPPAGCEIAVAAAKLSAEGRCRAHLEALGGAPAVPFPEDLDPAYAPSGVERALDDQAACGGAPAYHLDCSEFPCLVVEWEPPVDPALAGCRHGLHAALSTVTLNPGPSPSVRYAYDAVAPPGWDSGPNVRKRAEIRMALLRTDGWDPTDTGAGP